MTRITVRVTTYRNRWGKILQVLFICLQQADMQIDFLDSHVSTKQGMCHRWLARPSIPRSAMVPGTQGSFAAPGKGAQPEK